MQDLTAQNSENKTETLTKATVSVRIELPKSVHRKAMKVHASNPRSMRFADSLVDIIKKALEAQSEKVAA